MMGVDFEVEGASVGLAGVRPLGLNLQQRVESLRMFDDRFSTFWLLDGFESLTMSNLVETLDETRTLHLFGSTMMPVKSNLNIILN